MADGVVARKYAKSFLLTTGGKDSKKEEYQPGFDALLELYKIPESAAVLGSYVMPRDLKEELLNFALDKGLAPKELRQFVALLLDANRERFLPEIIEFYGQLLREALGEVQATVVASHPLSSEESSSIKAELEKVLGKKVHLLVVIDKKILGGVRIHVGNTVIDCSLYHKLNMLTTQVAS